MIHAVMCDVLQPWESCEEIACGWLAAWNMERSLITMKTTWCRVTGNVTPSQQHKWVSARWLKCKKWGLNPLGSISVVARGAK